MRLPRMTTRRWMMAVALVGLLCLLEQRRRSFATRSSYHTVLASRGVRPVTDEELAAPVIRLTTFTTGLGSLNDPHTTQDTVVILTRRHIAYHAEMARKYQHAARYPWLPVEPDPPEAR